MTGIVFYDSEGRGYSEEHFSLLFAIVNSKFSAKAVGNRAHALVEQEGFRQGSEVVLMLREFQAFLERRDRLVTPVNRKAVLPMVVADLTARIEKGTKEYGEPLTTFNGRNALMDAYEEQLDQVLYLRQQLSEMGYDL